MTDILANVSEKEQYDFIVCPGIALRKPAATGRVSSWIAPNESLMVYSKSLGWKFRYTDCLLS